MAMNQYISGLLSLRREIDNRIDNEIEDVIRKCGNSCQLKKSLEYVIEDNAALNGRYSKYEKNNIE